MKRASIAGLALALVVVLWCAAVWGLGVVTRAAYDRGDFQAAADTAKVSTAISVFQRHRAHFNRGTAWAAQGNLGPARLELERALSRSTTSDDCTIRINLALVVERQGDSRMRDQALAGRFYDHAAGLLERAPTRCRPPESELAQDYEDAQERLEEKRQKAEDEGDSEPGDSAPEDSDKWDAMDEKSRKAAERQADADRPGIDSEKPSGDNSARGRKPW